MLAENFPFSELEQYKLESIGARLNPMKSKAKTKKSNTEKNNQTLLKRIFQMNTKDVFNSLFYSFY